MPTWLYQGTRGGNGDELLFPVVAPTSLHRHTLRQIPRLIHIRTLHQRGVVAEQLQGDDVEDGGEHAVVFWQVQDVHAFAFGDLAGGVGFGVDVIRPIQPQARSAVAYPAPHWLGQA